MHEVHPGLLIGRHWFWLRKSFSRKWLELGSLFWKNLRCRIRRTFYPVPSNLGEQNKSRVRRKFLWEDWILASLSWVSWRKHRLSPPCCSLQISQVLLAPCSGGRRAELVAPAEDSWRRVLPSCGCVKTRSWGLLFGFLSGCSVELLRAVNPARSATVDEAKQKDLALKLMSGKYWSWQIEVASRWCFYPSW